ncbi:SDR family NAD(P)-dependent oxidoreductase [Streptomyces marokkonensis]|uniref:SDR family NAD(P)-dependent oxidoreductase n=1 Tax=Streptomyces marokkonensis TaxID=324855 RepID=A0ABW6QI91_9ACTN
MDWSSGAVRLLTEQQTWPDTDRPRRAGVSSFGLSGTNAHIILEQAPDDPRADDLGADDDTVLPWLLSGRNEAALRAQAERLLVALKDRSDVASAPMAHALATTRSSFEQRAVILASTHQELAEELQNLHVGEAGLRTVVGEVRSGGRTAFLFSGQGAQRAGMGRELYEAFPVFAEAFDAVCAHVGDELRDVVFGDDTERLDRTECTQPALFAVEVALFRLVESFGIRPDFLIGHSIGEVAAAHVAGVMSLEDACALVTARGRLMQQLPAGGVMVAVEAAEAEVLPLLENHTGEVSIAAVNGPQAVVIAGAEAAVEQVASALKQQGRRTTRLRVSHAFHSPLMDPMLEAFREVAERIDYTPPSIPVVSNVTGQLATEGELASADYWVRHVRQAVRFADGVDTLTTHGVTRFLEIGPDGTLTALTQNRVPDGRGSLLTPVLRKDTPEHTSVLRAMALFHVDGAEIDWTAALGGGNVGARQVDLPTYAFQRTRFWPTITAHTVASATGLDSGGDASFWSIVERGAPGLADVLGVPEDALNAVLPALTEMRRGHMARAEVDGWRYRVEWEPVELPAGRSLSGRWLLLQAPGDVLLEGLERFVPGLERVTCDARDRAGLARALRSAFDGAEPAGVLSGLCLSVCGPGEASPASGHHAGVADTMALVQALGDIGASAPLWVLTRAGFGPGRAPGDPAQAAVWGFGRVAALEHPERWGGLVDLAPQPGDDALAAVIAVLAHGGEDQVTVRGAAVHARRLRPAPLPTPVPVPSGDDGSRVPRRLLVTGGTGALGVRVAEWFTGRGTKELVLASRGGTGVEGLAGTVARLEAAGAERVEVVACDVADRAQVAALLRAHPVDGIAHVAGVLDVEPIDAMTPAQVERVMAAKALGTVHLEELTRDADLSAFVVFSSIAGVWGSGGQAAYAAANACADAVVEARRARGAAGVSVAWGPWSGGGMVSDEGATELERRGLRMMDPERALMGLESALAGSDAAVVVADVAWERFVPAFTSRRAASLLTGLPQAEGVREPSDAAWAEPGSAGGVPALVEQVAALPPQGRAEALLGHVRRVAAKALGHADTSGVGADRAFRDMGFDSLTAVELRNALIKDTGLSLPTTLVFDHPTPAALARHLDAELSGDGGSMATRLADLESSVARIMNAGPDQDVRTLLGARLRALLDEIEGAGGAGDGGGRGEADDGLSLGDRLEGASDEELFDLISRELEQ